MLHEYIRPGTESCRHRGLVEARIPGKRPMMRQDGAQKLYYIRDINIHGVQYLNSDILKSSAGLIAGDSIYLPSNFIANAISRLWSQRFSPT